jgi:hypothetical protein
MIYKKYFLKSFTYILFSIFCLIITIAGNGQGSIKQQKIDSLTIKFKKDSAHIYRFKNVRPFIAIDNRNSFIKNAPVNVKGFQLGVILKEKHTIGFGIYSLQNSSKQSLTAKNENNISTKRTLNLNYLTLFYQYVIIDKRFFELDLPLEVGLGGYHIKLEDTITHKIITDQKGGSLITSGGVNIILKPVRWIGISGTAGYRIALDKNPNVNFNGAYYSYGVWVDLRQIYRDIRFYGITRKKYKRHVKDAFYRK